MDFFRKMGKTFEETKREILNGASDPYVCIECEKGVTEEYDACPYCGEDSIVENDSNS